jgi:streptogramin lyase
LNFTPGGDDLAVGADSNFSRAFANTIERITPNGTVTDFTIPMPNAQAESITAGPDGNIRFKETSVDQIGRLDPKTGTISEFTPLVIESSPGLLSGDAGLLPIRPFDQRWGPTQAFTGTLDGCPRPRLH